MSIKTFNQGGVTVYETPTLTALDIKSEGLLCQSGELLIKDWESDGESLNF